MCSANFITSVLLLCTLHLSQHASSQPTPVTNEELADLTKSLFELEGPNNAADLVKINKKDFQLPLLTVDQAAYVKPTIAKLISLHDNYFPDVRKHEIVTPEETVEEMNFLDEIISTPIMNKALQFLVDKEYINVSEALGDPMTRNLTKTQNIFRKELFNTWFALYTRSKGPIGSSGFEHVFLGEIKKNKVSGLHNWVFFSSEEARNNTVGGNEKRTLNLGSKGSLMELSFTWLGKKKPLSSIFVGTSPELELALYTICFYTRQNKRCALALDGKRFGIQTHVMTKKNIKMVASAYPVLF